MKPDIVIDGDGHVVEIDQTYDSIDPEYYAKRPMLREASRGHLVRLQEGRVWGQNGEAGFAGNNVGSFPPGVLDYLYRRAGTYNPWARLPDMDADSIDVGVLYSSYELPLTVMPDSGYAVARAAAYNNWIHEYCSAAPRRLKGVGLVALQDLDAAIAELDRCADLGMVAVQVGCTVGEDTLLSDERLNPFWQEAERLNMPVAVHGPALPGFFRSYFDVFRQDHMLEVAHMAHAFAQMLACSNIITSGVLERFSKLKVAFLEAGSGWVPYWMHRMDEYQEVAPNRWAGITATPSEYIKSGRVFFSCEPGDTDLPYFLENIGDQSMLFASDYLHFDALFPGEIGHDGNPYPGTVKTLLAREDIPEKSKEKMLYENSVAFYRFGSDDLGQIGDEISRKEPKQMRELSVPGTVGARV